MDSASAVLPIIRLVLFLHLDLSTNSFVEPRFAISPPRYIRSIIGDLPSLFS